MLELEKENEGNCAYCHQCLLDMALLLYVIDNTNVIGEKRNEEEYSCLIE